MSVTVIFQRLDGFDTEIPLPAYATEGAAGADIRANLPASDRATGVTLAMMQRALIPTGLACAVPQGHEMQIRPRSGLALKHGLALVNAPGTIDADYRGPVGVLVINLGAEPFTVTHGMRIAQIVIAPAPQAQFTLTEALPATARDKGGFGSTGTG